MKYKSNINTNVLLFLFLAMICYIFFNSPLTEGNTNALEVSASNIKSIIKNLKNKKNEYKMAKSTMTKAEENGNFELAENAELDVETLKKQINDLKKQKKKQWRDINI